MANDEIIKKENDSAEYHKQIVYDIDNTSMYDVPIISMDIFKTKNDRKEK